MWRIFFVVGAAGTAFFSATAHAQESLWDIGLGLTATHIPHYIGADQAHDYVLPFPYLVYRGEKLKIDRNFIHGEFFESGKWRAEWSVAGSPPVNSDDNRARHGMNDIDAIGEFGPAVMYRLAENDNTLWRIEWPLRKATSTDWHSLSDRGWSSNPLLRFNHRWQQENARYLFEMTTGPVYNSERYNDYFYQVEPDDETITRRAFDARSGYSGWRFSLGISERRQQFWWGAFIRHMNLRDSVIDDSPLVREHDSWLVGIAFAWIFRSSSQLGERLSCTDDNAATRC